MAAANPAGDRRARPSERFPASRHGVADTSIRYIGSLHDDRTGPAGPPPRPGPPRLRAEEAAHRVARLVVVAVLRLPLSGPQPAGAGRTGDGGRPRRAG